MLRRRNLRSVFFTLIGLLVIAYLIGMVSCIREERKVNGLMAEIKAKGEPICAANLYDKSIHSKENAAIAYEAIFKTISSPKAKRDIKQLKDYIQRCNGIGAPLSNDDWAEFTTLATGYAHLIDKVKDAAGKPICAFNIHWEDTVCAQLPHLAKLRDINAIVCALSEINAKNGNIKSAIDDITLSLGVSNAIQNEPQIVSQLVRYDIITTVTDTLKTVIKGNKLDTEDITKLNNALSSIEVLDSYKQALTGERASFRTMFDDVIAGKMPMDDHDVGLRAFILRKIPLFEIRMRKDQYCFLQYMTKQVESSDLYYREPGPQSKAVQDNSRAAMMSRELSKAYPSTRAQRDCVIAKINGSRITLGLYLYKLKNGTYPEKLKELNGMIDQGLLEDPFSGDDVIYKRIGNGYLLYSIGKDLRDNGGLEPVSDKNDTNTPQDIVWSMDR